MQIIQFKCIITIALTALIWSCGHTKNDGQQAQSNLQVKGYKVIPQLFNSEVKTTANIMATEQVELKAPIAGQVLDIYFEEGTMVNKGARLIRIDDRSWKAQLVGVQAELQNAQNDYQRKRALLEVEGSSQEEIDNTFSTVETLKSQAEQLKVNIDLANVTAPFSGKLGMRDFSKGAFMSQGQTITTLTDLNRLKVDFSLAQNHQNSIETGKTVLVMIEKDTLEAIIYAISPIVHADSRTINVRAILNQKKEKTYIPGVFAEVLITTDFIDDALLIPTQAVVPSINDQTVYVVKAGKAMKTIVKLGNRTRTAVHITEGLSAGDVVLTTGLLHVKDGMPVTVQLIK